MSMESDVTTGGKVAEAPATGSIFDLGYQRYVGVRQAQGKRWQVIAAQQIRDAWKGWKRYKPVLGMAICMTVGFGIAMYIAQQVPAGEMSSMSMDVMLSWSFVWLAQICVIAGITIAAPTIAADRESGAFTFYFARPVRPFDYVFGKFMGVWLLQAALYLASVTLLSIMRLGFLADLAAIRANWDMLPKAIAIGLMVSVAFAAMPLGISAIAGKRRTAMILWAVYYLVALPILIAIGAGMELDLRPLHPVSSIKILADAWFRLIALPGGEMVKSSPTLVIAAIASLIGQAALFLGLAYWRVKQANAHGIGGA